MPWDLGAGIAAGAGAAAGLIGDSIKRERDLQDTNDLLALKTKIEEDKQARIAAIVGGVSRTKDVPIAGPTVDGSSLGVMSQAKTEGEYSRDVGDALTQKGLIEQSGKFYERADRSDDRHELRTTQAAAQKSADEKWHATEARQNKLLDETLRHNKAMEAKAGAERISPAARAQIDLEERKVAAAQKVESEAAKTLDAVRKNPAAMPEQVTQAESDYRTAKDGVATALKQYDEIGAAHFGDKWKKAAEVAPAVTGDDGPIVIKYKGTTPYKQGPNGEPVLATAADVARAAKQTAGAAGGGKPAGLIERPEPVTAGDYANVEAARAARKTKADADTAARMEAQRKRGEDIDKFNATMTRK
jgi:hypothetical protein